MEKGEEIAIKVENTTKNFINSLKGKIKDISGKNPKDEKVRKNTWYLLFSSETVKEITSGEINNQISGTVSKKEFLKI